MFVVGFGFSQKQTLRYTIIWEGISGGTSWGRSKWYREGRTAKAGYHGEQVTAEDSCSFLPLKSSGKWCRACLRVVSTEREKMLSYRSSNSHPSLVDGCSQEHKLFCNYTLPCTARKSPQAENHRSLQQNMPACRAAVPNLFGTRDRFHGRQFFHGLVRGWCRWYCQHEASLTHPPFNSCCAARFLTGCGPVPVHGPGVGDPWCRGIMIVKGLWMKNWQQMLHWSSMDVYYCNCS